MGRKKKNKTESVVSSTDEEKEEIVTETSVIEFACPMCKKILEMKNELEIQKKGNCKCSCVPTSFKISRNDKKMSIDKTKDSINLETDVHNIAIRFGRGVTPSDNGEKETQETVKQIMKNLYLKSRFNIIATFSFKTLVL